MIFLTKNTKPFMITYIIYKGCEKEEYIYYTVRENCPLAERQFGYG